MTTEEPRSSSPFQRRGFVTAAIVVAVIVALGIFVLIATLISPPNPSPTSAPTNGPGPSAGDESVSGLEGFEGREPNDIVLWVDSHRAVVSGDTVADFGNGLEVSTRWLREGVTPESRVERLRPLLEKPVEHVLATHGGPFEPADLERALSLP